MKKNIIAMVPVRKGSTRVPSKNTRVFADTTLLDLKLKVLTQIPTIHSIVVSTDCEKCMEIAQRHHITIQRREPFYAGSVVTNDVHWRHIADTTPGDVVFMAQVTSPFVRRSTFLKALDLFVSSSDNFNSLNSVSLEKKFFWQNGMPINYDVNKTPKSQDLPDIHSLNFAISIVDRLEMSERGNVVGSRPQFMELNKIESLDIDDETDFKFAETLYRELGEEWLLSS